MPLFAALFYLIAVREDPSTRLSAVPPCRETGGASLVVLSTRPDKLADEAGAYAGFKRGSGHLGFVKAVGVARFRKIEIKELKPVTGPPEKKQLFSSKGTQVGGTEVKESKPKATADGWVSLFNRKDLTGWKTHPVAPGDWRVEDGILIGRGPKVSHLYTERGDYEDLHFRIEAKINAGGNNGQSFRKQFSAKIGGDGYEAQIDSSSHKAKTGSLYIHTSPAVAVEQVLVPVDTWFTQEVIVRGNHIVILVNGQKTVDFIDKNNNYARDHLALQVYDPATVVHFRKIEIKELGPAVEPPKGYLGITSIRPALHGEPYIDEIAANSPAEKAGLKRGDTIVGLNDAKIHNIKELAAAFDNLKLKPGERITVRIISAAGKERSVTLTASEGPKSDERKTLPKEPELDPKIILDEIKKLAGAWSVVSLKDNGNDMPANAVKEVHVAGGVTLCEDFLPRPLLQDTHSHPVPEAALDLLDYALARQTPSTIVLERDDRLDAVDEILDDLARLRARLDRRLGEHHAESPLGSAG